MAGFSNTNEKKIEQVFYELLRFYGISRKYDEHRLKGEWGNVVGMNVAQQTQSLHIDKEVLYVKLHSASLRHELSFTKSGLILALNNAVGKKLIHDIVFR
ncbi:MAG: DUF721 domain-containing protein [Bacteroidales bacterium]|nr:DUF721 domain-containing protein [Bacteroidales bacterium]